MHKNRASPFDKLCKVAFLESLLKLKCNITFSFNSLCRKHSLFGDLKVRKNWSHVLQLFTMGVQNLRTLLCGSHKSTSNKLQVTRLKRVVNRLLLDLYKKLSFYDHQLYRRNTGELSPCG